MIRLIAVVALALSIAACASTITFREDPNFPGKGIVEASDYSIREVTGTNGKTSRVYVPNRWFTSGLIKPLFDSLGPLLKVID
jgi:hypothetical protein